MTSDEKSVQIRDLRQRAQELKDWWVSQMGSLAPEAAAELAEIDIALLETEQETVVCEIEEEVHIALNENDIFYEYELVLD